MNAQHLQTTAEWATPTELVEAARDVLGHIDLDPATSQEINARTVGALRYFDAKSNGLLFPWDGNVFVNPPGGCPVEKRKGSGGIMANIRTVCGVEKVEKIPQCSCKLVKQFWNKLITEYTAGHTLSAIWIGFSLEQLTSLQIGTAKGPLEYSICVPARRISFLMPDDDFIPAKQPTHGSYISYLGHSPRAFRERFLEFGEVK